MSNFEIVQAESRAEEKENDVTDALNALGRSHVKTKSPTAIAPLRPSHTDMDLDLHRCCRTGCGQGKKRDRNPCSCRQEANSKLFEDMYRAVKATRNRENQSSGPIQLVRESVYSSIDAPEGGEACSLCASILSDPTALAPQRMTATTGYRVSSSPFAFNENVDLSDLKYPVEIFLEAFHVDESSGNLRGKIGCSLFLLMYGTDSENVKWSLNGNYCPQAREFMQALQNKNWPLANGHRLTLKWSCSTHKCDVKKSAIFAEVVDTSTEDGMPHPMMRFTQTTNQVNV